MGFEERFLGTTEVVPLLQSPFARVSTSFSAAFKAHGF